jgi:hypothetical protein
MLEVEIPSEVNIRGPMLGMVPSLKYEYYNIQDEAQFPELHFDAYTKILVGGKVVTKAWAKPIYKSGIMTLLDVPHFGHNPNINHVSSSYSTGCMEDSSG